MNLSPIVHACSCSLPGGPYCEQMQELMEAKDRAYNRLLSAMDEVEKSTDRYGMNQAVESRREAQAEYDRLRSKYLDHRINGGPVEDDEEETQEPPRSEGSPTADPTHT